MLLNVSSTCAHHHEGKRLCNAFWPPDDEHMCSKYVEAWKKPIEKQKFCASSWSITEIKKTYQHVPYEREKYIFFMLNPPFFTEYTTNVVIQQNIRMLLMMDIRVMSEACWAHKKRNKNSKWHQVGLLFSTIYFCWHFCSTAINILPFCYNILLCHQCT